MRTKQQLLEETIDSFFSECIDFSNPEILKAIVDKSHSGLGTTLYEKVDSIDSLISLCKLQKEQAAGMKLSFKTTPISSYVSDDENTTSVAKECTIYLDGGSQIIEIYLRISVVLEFKKDKWLVVHWHASVPEAAHDEKDTFGFEALKQKNLALEKEVALRTAELVVKNRELAIEAALERVRSRSMAMQSTEDLAEVSALLDGEVRGLGIATRGCAFNIYGENDSTEWFSSEMGTLPTYKTPREYVFKTYYEAGENGEKLVVKEFDEETCPAHYEFLCTVPVMGDALKQMIASGGSFPERQIDHVAFFKYGYLLFITLEQVPEEHDIFIRFANAFEQTYTRFLDLQKAEAQSREAEIQLALERVRARTMAMHHSHELGEVAILLYKEFNSLNIGDFFNCGFIIINEVEGIQNGWLTQPEGSFIEEMNLPYPGDELIQRRAKAWKEKIPVHHDSIGGEKFKIHKKYVIERSKSTSQVNTVMPFMPDPCHFYCGNFEQGYLHIVTKEELREEDVEILSRFTKVFEQTYIRFLDLQKAEAQAREAQIEAALERVRSRTMAMQNSEELEEVILEVLKKLQGLGISMTQRTAAIFTYEDGNKDYTQWVASPEYSSILSFNTPYFEHPVQNDILNARQNGTDFFAKPYPVEVKNSLFKYLFALPALKNMPKAEKTKALKFEHYAISIAFQKQAALVVVDHSGIPLTEAENSILIRLSNVFNQTYSRFLDLQKAEAQAFRAEQDLVAIKEARKKAEEALSELQQTQKQLIQSEKMASLGELTAGIAHEIQNPLNFVNNFSEVSSELVHELKEELEKGDFEEAKFISDDLVQNLTKINHHGQRASSIVKGMLEHSRTSSGKKELTDINALADEYLRLAYHGLKAKDSSFNADFKTDFDQNLPKIEVIPQDIGRVLLNLINNGFQAVAEQSKKGIEGYKPTLIVSTKTENGQVLISVKDNGSGIPDAIKDKIFQPFFTTKPTGQGTGLGLSLAYDIVKAHGGELIVEIKEGDGTQFKIQLPIA